MHSKMFPSGSFFFFLFRDGKRAPNGIELRLLVRLLISDAVWMFGWILPRSAASSVLSRSYSLGFSLE